MLIRKGLPAKVHCTMAHVQFVTDILLIFAKQKVAKHNSLLKQLYEIGP